MQLKMTEKPFYPHINKYISGANKYWGGVSFGDATDHDRNRIPLPYVHDDHQSPLGDIGRITISTRSLSSIGVGSQQGRSLGFMMKGIPEDAGSAYVYYDIRGHLMVGYDQFFTPIFWVGRPDHGDYTFDSNDRISLDRVASLPMEMEAWEQDYLVTSVNTIIGMKSDESSGAYQDLCFGVTLNNLSGASQNMKWHNGGISVRRYVGHVSEWIPHVL